MNIILLSGGSGTRLWPLSNEVRSKQFLKIFRTEDDAHESMVQRMYRMIKEVDANATVTIATSQNQVASIHDQLGDEIRISIEPCRRDTFPAIALATAFLAKNGISRDDVVVVCPVDPYVDKDYFECLQKLSEEAESGNGNITLMGIEPTFPSPKYGYIIPATLDEISPVKEFKEKPNTDTARRYIKQGALWNGGIFAYKLGYVLDIATERFGTCEYDALYSNYSNLEKISFDYAVVEREQKINVIRFHGEWKDLGTWNTLPDAMSEATSGNSIAVECDNTHVINELSIPLIAMGIKNAVIVATPDGILVADKDTSSRLKNYAAEVALRPMYEKREWGEYKVLDYQVQSDGENSLTKELIIWAGKYLSYQRHQRRAEIWTVVKGEGEFLLDDLIRRVHRGDTMFIPRGSKHSIRALSKLHIIEVQVGDELVESDIERFPYTWNH